MELLDIKSEMDTDIVRNTISACLANKSDELYEQVKNEYLSSDDYRLYGLKIQGLILGVCGIRMDYDYAEILHIASNIAARDCGVGRTMIRFIGNRIGVPLEANVGDDVVGFFRKLDFQDYHIEQADGSWLWECIRPVPR